ncbi:hypothetical protein [Nocardioides sp. 1609]|uniref:hypothetical protein n=1 Tax=Nocardioides sp. 1609 TaxID=2508327 RepID=UPI0010705FB1|nr:hypothetical protein [Nocardioides sp. 1609]
MRWLRFVLATVGIAAVVALAVVPTNVVFTFGDSERVVDCGPPVTHSFGGGADEEVSIMSYNEIVLPEKSCREQSRTRLGIAGGVAVLVLGGAGYQALRHRRPQKFARLPVDHR